MSNKIKPENPSHADHLKAYMNAPKSLAYKKMEAALSEEVKRHKMYLLVEYYREIEREENETKIQ